jgi:hypothetical protein
MGQIELSDEEQELLGQILQNALLTLELEIQHTDHADFRQLLRRRREVIRRLIARFPKPAAAAA